MSVNEDSNEIKVFEHWDIEYQNTAAAYRELHSLFIRIVSMYLSIMTILITVVLAVSQWGKGQHVEWLMPTFRLVCLLLGIAGLVFVVVLIRYRFLIIQHARWLNGLRHVLQQSEGWSWIQDTGLPLDPKYPHYLEIGREMGFFVVLGAIVNSFYFYLGIKLPNISIGALPLIWYSLASIGVHLVVYYLMSSVEEGR